ncbi:unnamed protein product, partial [Ilex paraguariensis]
WSRSIIRSDHTKLVTRKSSTSTTFPMPWSTSALLFLRKKLVVDLSRSTRHLPSHLQSKTGLRQDRQFLMFISTYSHAKVVTLRKMMKFMML